MAFATNVFDRASMSGRVVPSGRTIDLEIMDLHSAFPDVAEHLPAVFEQCVISSVKNLLARKEARIILRLLKGIDLGSPDDVYSAIDRACPLGGSLLKTEIAAEFHGKVRNLFKQAIGNCVDSAELVRTSVSLASRLGA